MELKHVVLKQPIISDADTPYIFYIGDLNAKCLCYKPFVWPVDLQSIHNENGFPLQVHLANKLWTYVKMCFWVNA